MSEIKKLRLVELVNPENNERESHLLNPSVFSESVDYPVIQYLHYNVHYNDNSPNVDVIKERANTEIRKIQVHRLLPMLAVEKNPYGSKGHAELHQELEKSQKSLENCKFLKYYNPINLKEGPTAVIFEILEAVTIGAGISVHPTFFIGSVGLPILTEVFRRWDKKDAKKGIAELEFQLQGYDNFFDNVKRAEIHSRGVPEVNREVNDALMAVDKSPHMNLDYDSLDNKLIEIYGGIE